MTHLRLAGAPAAMQRDALENIVRSSPTLMLTLQKARALNLPDWWIVSGAIYNQVWNHLTGRPDMYGVKDIDLFYFDPDTSYAAEDAVIKRVTQSIPGTPPVEPRNQARVHLWYADHFGTPCPAYENARQPIDNFACRTHCVGLQLDQNDQLHLYAPYGLDDIFSFRITPNTRLNNRATHEGKAARQLALWPELTFIPWPKADA
jgi:uncharacterized protein